MNVDLNTTTPYKYAEWRRYYNDISTATELPALYNNYLIEWKEEKERLAELNTDYNRNTYIQFLKNINLSTIEPSAREFLSKIDTDDIYELELSVHYYVEIIKSQLENIRSIREEAKFLPEKNKLKNSRTGIKNYLHNLLTRLLFNKEFITEQTDTEVQDINVPLISNKVSINLNTYVSDTAVYKTHAVDKNLILDLKRKVLNEAPNIIQLFTINKGNKKLKVRLNNVSTPNSMLGINDPFDNFDRLPSRYFRQENKRLENLIFTYEKGIVEKYLANDLYYVSGTKEKAEIKKLFDNVNTTNNLSQRHAPSLFSNLVDIKHKEIYPKQLSFSNTGVTNFNSYNITFNVVLSAITDNGYLIPNPNKYQPGVKSIGYIKSRKTGDIIRNIKFKPTVPFVFKSKTDTLKNPTDNSSIDIYNNRVPRNFGYQSKENSIDYTFTGINRREDNISFWEDAPDQINWRNTDTYPVSVLNTYPEQDRLNDLLINNKTGITIKSDIYGNEFFHIKPVYPKRKAGTSYISSPAASSSTECVTAAEYYDGLYFSTLLEAVSSAYYESSGTLYDSITGVYDTFLTSHSTSANGTATTPGLTADGEKDMFFAPLSTASCSDITTQGLSCGSVSADEVVDCGEFVNHPGNSTDLVANYFVDTTVPYFTIDTSTIYSTGTTYESSSLNNFADSDTHLFEQQHVSAGEVYVRNVDSQIIEPLSTAFVSVFNKHNTGSTKSNILSTSNIIYFDIIESTIVVQTSAETVTELYKFEDGKFKNGASSKSIIT